MVKKGNVSIFTIEIVKRKKKGYVVERAHL